jgi:hypothetical protein
MRHFVTRAAAMVTAIAIPFAAYTKPLTPNDIPAALKPWEAWVMHDVDRNTCPFLYMQQEQRVCFWPTKLQFDLHSSGGSFMYDVTLYETPDGKPQRIILPGQTEAWPQNVSVNGNTASVLLFNAQPTVLLSAGTYTIRGDFLWERAPVSLKLPPQVGIVGLIRSGETVAQPDIEADQLWIARENTEQKAAQEDHVEAKLFRKVTDSIPQTLETVVQINASGKQREQVLGMVLPEGVVPISISSDIPARLERDGTLRAQLRPGNWQIRVTGRYSKKQDAIAIPKTIGVFAPDEIWSFEAQNQLRLVQVEGVNAIDPTQTELPTEWHSLPSYYVKGGDVMTLTEKKRGIADETPDQLQLSRKIWLDYSGMGYTFQDLISGTIRRSNRLEVNDGITLGNASINGTDQYITTITHDGQVSKAGVEVREGFINLQANSRSDYGKSLSITGWSGAFDNVSAQLFLPPGWELFSYSGIDSVSQSWVSRWTLLDLFLVLVASVAMWKWMGVRGGCVTLLGLVLIHPVLPVFTSLFLALIALSVIVRFLPQGWFRGGTVLVHRFTLLALVIIALPFMVDHIRAAVYPQLADDFPARRFDANIGMARPEAVMKSDFAKDEKQVFDAPEPMNEPTGVANMVPPPPPPIPPALPEVDATEGYGGVGMNKMKSPKRSAVSSLAPQQQYQLYAPDTKVQTGFGTRNISEYSIDLRWNGSVDGTATMRLWLISANQNLMIAIVRILLMALLIAMLLKEYWKPIRDSITKPLAVAIAIIVLSSVIPFAPAMAQTQPNDTSFPPDALLATLKNKLTEAQQQPVDCLPECASLSRSVIQVSGNQLILQLEIHARENVAVPLPGSIANWRPQSVVIGEQDAPTLSVGGDGYLMVNLKTGVHRVRMIGSLPASRDSIGITFPLTSRYSQVIADGWSVTGVRENGITENSIQLIRTAKAEATEQEKTLDKTVIPPFYQVNRTLTLGNRWEVTTYVSRMTPVDEPAAVAIPLLPGETVTSPDAQVKDGKIQITFNPGDSQVMWQSIMNPTDSLTLVAPTDTPWVEVWRLSVSNLWHVITQGIPRVYEENPATTETYNVLPGAGGVWQWMPWAGETLQLSILRPQGVEGETRTIDASSLTVTPSKRSTDVALAFTIRSSLGGQHDLLLPKDVALKQVTKDGLTLPVQIKDQKLTLPLTPGNNRFAINWKENAELSLRYKAPAIDIGAPRSVNAVVNITMPQDRWILMAFGPTMGPAVLFWSWVPIVLLLAFALGKIPFTPLKSRHWFLLLLGLSMNTVLSNMLVVGWLLALGYREKLATSIMKNWRFNLVQIGLVILTLVSISTLYDSIQGGLLGTPDMRITGNGSYGNVLNWYQDITSSVLPQPSVLSVPVWVYRAMMLLWALWLAFSMVSWLRWGWSNFVSGGYWRKVWGTVKQSETVKVKETGPTD